MLNALWQYRGFILGAVRREFESRYRNSLLGAAWTILQPLAMIIVYTVVFARMIRSHLPGMDGRYAYSIFLCSGVLTWGLFSEIVNRGQGVFLENGNMIKKLNFPRICLPAIAVTTALLNFSIIFSLFTIFLIITGNFPGISFASALPVLAIQIAFATGLGVIAGVLNVFFRDTGQFITIVLQFWFWFTPIIYSALTLPEFAQHFMRYNPMAPMVEAYQSIFVYRHTPTWSSLLPTLFEAALLCALGLYLFRRHAADMVDEL